MQAPPLVVLAAGMSTRYGRLKQVDPMGPSGESIMDYNVFDAARAGFSRVVFVVREEIEDQVEEHVQRIIGDAFPVAFVRQTLDQIPGDLPPPPERRKPWGTAQAVLCASEVVEGPFAVCNADDFYGENAFRQLLAHLTLDPPATEAAMVGYNLSDTLSDQGGVARGICIMGRDHLLQTVTEVREIRRVEGWITGEEAPGEQVELRGNEIVSMNLWGFSDPVVELLERQFLRFLKRWGGDTTAEFPLSTAISEQVQSGTRVAVLSGRGDWFGVTHAADGQQARAALRARIEAAHYPADLAAAFRDVV